MMSQAIAMMERRRRKRTRRKREMRMRKRLRKTLEILCSLREILQQEMEI
jgi:hypothetical protein